MNRTTSRMAALPAAFALALMAAAGAPSAAELEVVSETTATGFKFPESVAYDAAAQVLYVSEFGSELKPTQKDGAGRISKVALDGTVLEEGFLPAEGQTLDKPKGIWIAGDRLWTTDIDSVWVFDTETKEGREVALPGIEFANDPTVIDGTLYVSDNRGDQLYSVSPADFLKSDGEPEVTRLWSGKSINPNGLYPAGDGALLMVGFATPDSPRGIHVMAPGAAPKALSKDIGLLDGVYALDGGALLVTDWNSGTLGLWRAGAGMTALASGFKGPADFAVAPNEDGLLVVVPDLVKSELRLVQLAK